MCKAFLNEQEGVLMIAKVRKFVHSPVYKVFLWIFMIAFLGSGIVVINFGGDKNWVIKVYKQTLTQPKFQEMLKRVKYQQDMYRQKGFAFAHQNIQKETVQVAISGLLAQHAMNSLGMQVAPEYVDAQFQQQLQQQLPSYFFKSDGSLDEQAFQKAIAPQSMQDLVSGIELEVKNKLLFGLVDATVYVPEFEMILQYNAEFANKKYSFIILPYQKYLAQVRTNIPSDEALAKFYKKSSIADQFRTVERRAGRVWKFSVANFVGPISDNDAKQFYDKHKMQRYVLEPAQMQVRVLLINPKLSNDSDAKEKIEEIYQTAQKNPEQFAQLVVKFSQDSNEAVRGGLTDFFAKNDSKMDTAVIETAFDNLATDGQISVPLKTERGYELIQRVAKKPAKYKDFKSVEIEIKKDLASEKFKKRFLQDASRIVSGAKYNPESLQKFIERYKGIKSELPLDVRKSGIEYTNLFKTEDGRYSSFLDKDQGIIMLCSQVEKSTLPAFTDVKSKVLNLYFEEQAVAALKEQLALAHKDAANMSLQDVAKKYDTVLQHATFINTDGKIEQSAILKETQVAKVLKGMQHVGAVTSVLTKLDGVLIKLDDISSVNSQVFQEQKEHLEQVMFYMKLYQIKEGFIASLYRTATLNNKIEIKNELLQFTKEV